MNFITCHLIWIHSVRCGISAHHRKQKRLLKNSAKRQESQIHRIWRNRHFFLVEEISMRSWSRVIQRNSGEESVQNFRHLLSNVCHSALFTIITISMTDIRELRLAVIQQSLRRCWKGQKFAQGLISLNSEKRIRRLQRRLFLQEWSMNILDIS